MLAANARIASVLSSLGTGEKAMLCRLWQNWDMVMGEELAELAIPLGARNDLLVIGGEDNMVLQELSYMKEEILERVNAFMGVPLSSPCFCRVELQLLLGRRPLNLVPDIYPSERRRPAPSMPPGLGGPLQEMRPDSPVTRAYLAYLTMFGIRVDS